MSWIHGKKENTMRGNIIDFESSRARTNRRIIDSMKRKGDREGSGCLPLVAEDVVSQMIKEAERMIDGLEARKADRG